MNRVKQFIREKKQLIWKGSLLSLIVKGLILLLLMLSDKGASAQIQLSKDTVYAGESLNLSYSWSGASAQTWYFGDGDSSLLATAVHQYQSTACGYVSYTISLKLMDSAGNHYTFNRGVVVKNLPPTPALADQDPFTPFSNCDNSPSLSNPNFTLSVNNLTSDTSFVSYYVIDWGDNTNPQTVYNQSFPLSHTYAQLGLFYLNITAYNAQGCTASKTYEVANQSNPAVGISSMGSTQGCAPQEFTFILSQYQNNSPGTYYVWDFGDGSPQVVWSYNDPFLNDSIKHTFQITSCGQSNHAFTVSVTAHNHCDQTTATVSNIRIYSPPIADFSSAADTSCTGTMVSFANSTQSGFGYNCNGNANYLWDFGDGSTSTAANPQHSWAAPGIYTVKLLASNGVCGFSSDSTRIVINTTPQALVSSSTLSGCDTFIINTVNQSSGGNLRHQWSLNQATGWAFSGNTTATDAAPVIQFMAPGIYSLHYSAANNCGLDDTIINIKAMAAPQISLTSIPDFCGSAVVNPSAQIDSFYAPLSAVLWSFPGGSPAFYAGHNPGAVSYTDSGTYIVALQAANQCGSDSVSLSFVVHPLPQVQLTASDDTICYGDTLTLLAMGALNYQWLQSPAALSVQNSQLHAAPSTNSSYIVQGIDSHQCINTDTLTVTVNTLPAVQLTYSGNQLCQGDTFVAGASGASAYTWYYNGQSVGNAGSVSFVPALSANLLLKGIDQNACVNYDTVAIHLWSPPGIQLNQFHPAICSGDTFILQIGGATSINVSGPAMQNMGNGQFALFSSASASYNVEAYDLPGCTSDTTVVLDVHQLPNVHIGGSSFAACTGDSLPLIATGAVSYQWLSSTGFSQSGNSISYPVTQNSSLQVEGIDQYGCRNSDTVSVIAKALPSLSVSPATAAVCTGDSITLSASGAISWQWMLGSQMIDTAASVTLHPASVSTYTLKGTAANGCSAVLNKTVHVYSPPQISWTAANTGICAGDSTLVTLSGANSWFLNQQAVSSSFYLSPSQTTSYTIMGQNANNCSDTAQFVITVHALPQVAAQASPSSICLGQSSTLSAQGALNYLWSPSNGLSVNNGSTITAAPVGTTTYTVIGTDTFGCSNTDTVSIHVSTLYSINLTASAGTICKGDTVLISASGAQNYQWNQAPNIIQSNGGQLWAAPSGNATYAVTGSDSMGCIATQSITIQVQALPAIQATASSTHFCPGDSVVLSASGGSSYQWLGFNTSGSSLIDYPSGAKQYIVKGSDAYGCTNSDTINVYPAPLPVVALSANDSSVCQGQQVMLYASGANVYQWCSMANTQQNGWSASAQPVQSQWFWVRGYNNYGCEDRDSLFITVNPLPAIQPAQSSWSLCQGDSVMLSISTPASSVSWSPGTGLSSLTGKQVKASPANSTNYQLTAIDSNGCFNTANISVLVNPLPQASFSCDTLHCLSSPVAFTNNSSGASSYQWSFGDGNTSATVQASHSYQNTGYYQAELRAYSAANCMDSSVVTIHLIDAPTAYFSPVSDTGCSPFTTYFVDSSEVYGGSYFWSFGNGMAHHGSSPPGVVFTAGPGHDTSYVVQLTTSNLCGNAIYRDTIYVLAAPRANFGFITSSSCSPLVATFGNISSSNSSSWYWDMGDTTYYNGFTPPPHTYTTGNSPRAYPVTLVAGNQCGSDTAVKVVVVNPNYVHAVFTPSHFNACAPAAIQFANYSNIQNMASWNFGDGNVSTQIAPVHIYQNAGTYQVTLVVTDNCGIDTAQTTIHIGAPPQLNFTISDDSICQYESLLLSNNTSNVSNITWLFGDSTLSHLQNTQHSYQHPGVYQLRLVGHDSQSQCPDTASRQIVVLPAARAHITTDTLEGCYPLTVNFVSQSTGNSYQLWDFDNGSSSVNPAVQQSFSQAGNYHVKLIAGNYYACNDTAEVLIKAYPHPQSSFSWTNTSPCHFPAGVQFNNLSTGASAYSWSFGNGSYSSATNPQHDFNAGSYQVSLISYNFYRCSDTSTVTLKFDELPLAAFNIDKKSACEGEEVQFINLSSHADLLSWYPGNGHTSSLENPLITYDSAGLYFPMLIARNDDGCYDTAFYSDTLVVYPSPKPDFDWQLINEPKADNGHYRMLNLSRDANSFYWDFGDGNSSTDINPQHQYYDFGDYDIVLYASNDFGCSNQVAKRLRVDLLKGLYIPTALAPGHPNPEVRLFTPKGKGLSSFHLAIYDAWGNLIWQTERLSDGEPAESWDGTCQGQPVPQGVYYWKATARFLDGSIWQGMPLKDGRVVRQGTVTLIR